VKFLSKVTEQKGIVARVNTLTAVSNTFTPNCDTTDIANITLGATNTIANPTGTPTDGQSLILRLIQDGTGGRTIGTWGNQYHFAADLPPSLHSGAGRVDLIEFRYRSAASRWECMSELDLRGVVGRNQRTTPIDDAFSSATSVLTAQAFVRPGRTYRITGVAEIAPAGGSAILADYSLRYTTNGSTPGTGSAQLNRALVYSGVAAGIPVAGSVTGLFHATSSGTLRVALVIGKAAGGATGLTLRAGGGASGQESITYLEIEDVGTTVSAAS